VDWIELSSDRFQLRAHVKAELSDSLKFGNFFAD
jgi:hypothetical protein